MNGCSILQAMHSMDNPLSLIQRIRYEYVPSWLNGSFAYLYQRPRLATAMGYLNSDTLYIPATHSYQALLNRFKRERTLFLTLHPRKKASDFRFKYHDMHDSPIMKLPDAIDAGNLFDVHLRLDMEGNYLINKPNSEGNTPLAQALKEIIRNPRPTKEDHAIVKALIARGARLDISNHYGETPLDLLRRAYPELSPLTIIRIIMSRLNGTLFRFKFATLIHLDCLWRTLRMQLHAS